VSSAPLVFRFFKVHPDEWYW